MKAYQYLLFRIYMFYKDTMKEKTYLTFSTSLVSTLLVTINLMTVYFYLEYKDLVFAIPNKYFIIALCFLIWAINYFVIVRKERFLNRNFQKDKKGGYIVVGFIILTALFFIIVSNLNRDKIFNKKSGLENTNK